jgi:threonine aldolase
MTTTMGSARTGGIVDMRGDWAAPPTDAMRRAMAEAEVGDDNSQEDPTVLKLEEMTAAMFGREAALFVPSGTMGNLVSILSQAAHGEEIIVGSAAHTFIYEVGGAAAIGGHPFHTVANDRLGMMNPDDVREAIRPANIHFPRTAMLLLENTHNLRGGTVLTRQQMAALIDVVKPHGVRVHLDGSRVFHVAATLGCPVSELTADVDSLTFCLSKGLAAPVGSMVVGSSEFIGIARQKRKLLGGGMRQAGVIGAAGVVALEQMVDRLPDDHATARKLAEGLADMPGLTVDLDTVQTNLVFVDTDSSRTAPELVSALAADGIRANIFTDTRFRFATHYCVDMDDVQRVLQSVHRALNA